jgi:hypothetical protein
VLSDLLAELRRYPAPREPVPQVALADTAVAAPFRLRSDAGLLSFISTTTVFGTPVDITLAELAVEAMFPADAETAVALRTLNAQKPQRSAF